MAAHFDDDVVSWHRFQCKIFLQNITLKVELIQWQFFFTHTVHHMS